MEIKRTETQQFAYERMTKLQQAWDDRRILAEEVQYLKKHAADLAAKYRGSQSAIIQVRRRVQMIKLKDALALSIRFARIINRLRELLRRGEGNQISMGMVIYTAVLLVWAEDKEFFRASHVRKYCVKMGIDVDIMMDRVISHHLYHKGYIGRQRVRKRLFAYYLTPKGKVMAAMIREELQKLSYIPGRKPKGE